jgi:outer membrane protein assembly factor BamA
VLSLYEANYGFYHRANALAIGGDAEGTLFGLEQAAMVPRHLLLDLATEQISKAAVRFYRLRGMTTRKNDYNLAEVSYEYNAIRLTSTFWERRLEAYLESLQDEPRIRRFRDSSGTVISSFAEPLSIYETFTTGNVRLDLTDDYVDPRRGIRLDAQYRDVPRADPTQPDAYVVTAQAQGYVPLGRISTLALMAFQSDAYVRKPGLTDLNALNLRNNQNCAPGDAACQAAQKALVDNALAANTRGTSQSLGGQNYLRAYPGNRFQGAHTLYYAVEIRANLTDEFTPFNYFFFKGVRTAFQIAPFYEAGSVAETSGSLGQYWRTDAGVGLRFVTASGALYRIDIAEGDEGSATTIIFSYPW